MTSPRLVLLLTLLAPVFLLAQAKTKGYQLVFGKDTFQTETIIAKDPYTKNSLREDSYLFRNQKQIIKIPQRIDRTLRGGRPGGSRIEIDTVDQVEVAKIIDTISRSELNDLINAEIQIYDSKTKLKFRYAMFEAIQPSGKTSYSIQLDNSKIKDEKRPFESISSIQSGGYLIFRTVWFYDSKRKAKAIECKIAWKIE